MKTHACLTALLIAISTPTLAELSETVAQVELIPGWRTESGTHMAGLKVSLAPEWKTYWRAPGEAGIPPSFDWTGSSNIGGVGVRWPTPEVFNLNGMQTIGYSSDVVFPLEFTLTNSAQEARVSGVVQLGVCKDVCVPMSLAFDAVLGTNGARNAAIVSALIDRPMTASEAGVAAAHCSVKPSKDGLEVRTSVSMAALGPSEVVVIESSDPDIWVTQTVSDRAGGVLTSSAEMIPMGTAPVAFDRGTTRITILADGRAVEITGCQSD